VHAPACTRPDRLLRLLSIARAHDRTLRCRINAAEAVPEEICPAPRLLHLPRWNFTVRRKSDMKGRVFLGSPLQKGQADVMRMKFEVRGETLTVVEVRELRAENFQDFRERVRAAMPAKLRNIEIDLSQTSFLDSCGLGALISLRKTAKSRNGKVRLLYPNP